MDIAVLWFSMHVTHMRFVQIVCIGSVAIAVQYSMRLRSAKPVVAGRHTHAFKLSSACLRYIFIFPQLLRDMPRWSASTQVLVNREHFASDRCSASVATNIVSDN